MPPHYAYSRFKCKRRNCIDTLCGFEGRATSHHMRLSEDDRAAIEDEALIAIVATENPEALTVRFCREQAMRASFGQQCRAPVSRLAYAPTCAGRLRAESGRRAGTRAPARIPMMPVLFGEFHVQDVIARSLLPGGGVGNELAVIAKLPESSRGVRGGIADGASTIPAPRTDRPLSFPSRIPRRCEPPT